MLNKSLFSSKSENWETPKNVFNKLNQEFSFRLDACAAKDNALCSNYFTKEDDALIQDWSKYKTIWMNPPYGRKIGIFIKKAYEESLKDCVVCCLIPARTDTKWWHNYCSKGEVRFISGRLKFINKSFPSYDPNNLKISSAPFPSAIVIFGTKISTSYIKFS